MPNEQQAVVSSEVVEEILRAITQLRFGSIEITVHEGRVTPSRDSRVPRSGRGPGEHLAQHRCRRHCRQEVVCP